MSKYRLSSSSASCNHLPLYRQKKIFEREGIKIPASTLTNNTAAFCQSLKPIYNALRRELLANLYQQADDTGRKVLQSPERIAVRREEERLSPRLLLVGTPVGISCSGRRISLVRPAADHYQPGSGQEGPKNLLKDFTGLLQSDGLLFTSPCSKIMRN